METQKPRSGRLSRIKTRWTMVFQAHRGQGHDAVSAQEWLLLRYYRSVFRYLRAMTRDGDTAEELTHEFVVRFLRGDFKRADPTRGRFRDLLKRALRHLAIDHWRRKRVEKEKRPAPLPENWEGTLPEADWRRNPPPRRRPSESDLDPDAADKTFLRGWRAEMLGQAWKALARFQDRTGSSYHTVLRTRADHPKSSIADLARLLSARLDQSVNEAAFRQMLLRARQKFADFLVAEVARSLATSDPDAVEAELIELELLMYCRQSVARLRKSNFLESRRRRRDDHRE